MSSIYRLLGDPVEHSVSPALYTAAFDLLGLDASYETRRVAESLLPAAMLEAAALGGGNVTLPHKLRAAAVLDRPSPAVRRTGACNSFWLDADGSLAGDNTDVSGFLAAATDFGEQAGLRLAGAACLVLGAGGAARAVLVGLAEAGADSADVLNRTSSRVARLLADVKAGALELRVLGEAAEASDRYDFVINATSLGLRADDPLPIDLARVETKGVFDCVYAAGRTRWTRHASEMGIPCTDGLEMLVEQARGSLRNWLGLEIDPIPLRHAATAALGANE